MRIAADFEPKFSKIIFAVAKFRVRNRARSHENPRCPTTRLPASPRPAEVSRHYVERRHAAAREIPCDSQRISNRNFRKFSRPQNFAFEIARDRAEIHAACLCLACLRPLEVPNICCERQHAVPREISCDSKRISDRNFRKFKILRSKTREIAAKSMPPGGAQLPHDP